MSRLWLLLLCLPLAAVAGELRDIEVRYEDDRFLVTMAVHIQAPVADVWAVLADHDGLGRLNDSIQSVQRLPIPEDAAEPLPSARLQSTIRVCVTFYCRELAQVQDVYDTPPTALEAQIDPAVSDFRYGAAQWTLQNEDGGTLLSFDSQLEPDFWIPPVIGPWLVRRKMRAEALETTANIERLATQ